MHPGVLPAPFHHPSTGVKKEPMSQRQLFQQSSKDPQPAAPILCVDNIFRAAVSMAARRGTRPVRRTSRWILVHPRIKPLS
jgi:hypothetical protein